MEHREFAGRLAAEGITLDPRTADRIFRFAVRIYEANRTRNLTGCSTLDEIIDILIIDSLHTHGAMDVPRGTSIADIGSGAGIPGIIMACCYPGSPVTLVDGNGSKCRFMEDSATELGLENCTVICRRVEEMAHEEAYRERFGLVTSRAMASLLLMIEMGSGLCIPGGNLVLATSIVAEQFSRSMLDSLVPLGVALVPGAGVPGRSLHLIKTVPLGGNYPRRFPAARRHAEKIMGTLIDAE